MLDVLWVVVLPANDDHVFRSSTDIKLVRADEAEIASTQIIIVVFSDDARMERLRREVRVVPVAHALAGTRNPDFADSSIFQRGTRVGIDNANRDVSKRIAA